MIEVYRDVAADRRLDARAVRVFVFVAVDLDPEIYRPLKLLAVARAVGMKRQRASDALRRLVESGYLDRRGRSFPGGPYLYRLTRFT